MDWRDFLHFKFHGGHVLFESLRLTNWSQFLAASIWTLIICLSERLVTYTISMKWNPLPPCRQTRLLNAMVRTALYWVVTALRLLYMLIAMTFNVGLILVLVTSLSMGQFCIEYLEDDMSSRQSSDKSYAPLHQSDEEHLPNTGDTVNGGGDAPCCQQPPPPDSQTSYPTLTIKVPHPQQRRARRPETLYIHPNLSNHARAAAVQDWDTHHKHERTVPHGLDSAGADPHLKEEEAVEKFEGSFQIGDSP